MQLCKNRDYIIFSSSTAATQTGHNFLGNPVELMKLERVKADFQSVEISERAEILLFVRENVALKLNR